MKSVYLDSSALVKLIRGERESDALRRYLVPRPIQATSRITLVEVSRAAHRSGSDVDTRVEAAFAEMSLIDVDPHIERGRDLGPSSLRSLDAIHLATALELGSDLEAIVTYDRRLAAAARLLGLPVASPT